MHNYPCRSCGFPVPQSQGHYCAHCLHRRLMTGNRHTTASTIIVVAFFPFVLVTAAGAAIISIL